MGSLLFQEKFLKNFRETLKNVESAPVPSVTGKSAKKSG